MAGTKEGGTTWLRRGQATQQNPRFTQRILPGQGGDKKFLGGGGKSTVLQKKNDTSGSVFPRN